MMSRGPEQDDRPKAARLAGAFPRDPLFEHTAAEVGIPTPGSHFCGSIKQLRILQSCLPRESRELFLLVDAHSAPLR